MNKIAQYIYNMEHNKNTSTLIDTLSVEEKRMLTELSPLLGQSSDRLAELLDDGPNPTDWAFSPYVATAN